MEAVNLANNHSFDYGTTGFNDTKAALQDAGITSFGYDRTNTYEVDGVKIGLFGVNELDGVEKATSLMKQDIEHLQQDGCAIIVGCFHWGNEGEYEVTSTQVTLAHEAVDAGCDLVLGTHPHVLQGVEYYKQLLHLLQPGQLLLWRQHQSHGLPHHDLPADVSHQERQLVPGEAMRTQVRVVPCLVSSSNERERLPAHADFRRPGGLGDRGAQRLFATLAGDGAEFSTRLDESGYSQVK